MPSSSGRNAATGYCPVKSLSSPQRRIDPKKLGTLSSPETVSAMSYTAPSGWIESRPSSEGSKLTSPLFHQQPDCAAIKHPSTLTATDKPYGAKRCHRCATR